MHKRLFKEKVRGRKTKNEGDISIAIERGVIKMVNGSNSIGYNKRINLISDKIRKNAMKKHKAKEISPLKTIELKQSEDNNIAKLSKVLSVLKNSDKLLESEKQASNTQKIAAFDILNDAAVMENFYFFCQNLDKFKDKDSKASKFAEITKFINNFKKIKNNVKMSVQEMYDYIETMFKEYVNTKRQRKAEIRSKLALAKSKSQPQLELPEIKNNTRANSSCTFTFIRNDEKVIPVNSQ